MKDQKDKSKLKPPKKSYFDMQVINMASESNDDQAVIIDTNSNNNNNNSNSINHNNNHNNSNNKHDISFQSLKSTCSISKRIRIQLYRHPPFFIVFISIFQLVTFVYYTMRSEDPITAIGPVPFSSKLIYNPHRRYEIWRYLTYGLIHAGYWHLIFNLIIQLAIGIPLEVIHEFKPIFWIYMGGVVSGSLGNSLADPHSYLAGSSSGCYALMAAHMSNLIINWNSLKDENPAFKLTSLIVFGLTDLGIGVYERHYKPGSVGWHTSYVGHLAGAVSGLLLGFMFLKRFESNRCDPILRKLSRFTFYSLISIGILINILHPTHFPLPDYRELVWSQSPYYIDKRE